MHHLLRSLEEEALLTLLQWPQDRDLQFRVLRDFFVSTRKKRQRWLIALDTRSFDQLDKLKKIALDYGTASGIELKDAIIDILDMRRSQGRARSR